jgi:uncharacterized protein (DUF3820 family)
MPNEDKKPAYKDTDLMNFGKFKNVALQDVPASYLHWWYTETDKRDIRLRNYIENNLDALKEEYPDGIWK